MIFSFSFLNLWSPVATLCVAFFLVLFWNCRYYWRRRIDSCAQHLIGLPRRRRSDGIEGGGVGLPKSLLIQIFRRPRAPSAATSSLFQVEEDSGSIFAPLLSRSLYGFVSPPVFFFLSVVCWSRCVKQMCQRLGCRVLIMSSADTCTGGGPLATAPEKQFHNRLLLFP